MSSNSLSVVIPAPLEVVALNKVLQDLATTTALDRFELAVSEQVKVGIKDDNDLREADRLLREVAVGGDTVESTARPEIAKAHAVHKALVAATNVYKDRWTALRSTLEKAILKYKADQRELARRQQAELDRAAQAQRDEAAAAARAAMREGNVVAAKAAMQAAQAVVTPIIATSAPALDHSKDRRPWQAEVTDGMALVKAIAAGLVPIGAIKEFDLVFIKRQATALNGLNWPGVQVKQTDALTVRR